MVISLTIMGLALVVIAAMLEIATTSNPPICTIVATVGAVSVIGALCSNIDKPTALDVYQGKTTLHVTYEGKTPIDSVVVYKANKK